MPMIVDNITIMVQKAAVFLTPITPPMTRMLGRDRAGPANRRDRAGPFPMPAPMSPWSIGTSVRVAKYINAPETDANRLAHREFPPTRELI